jgi:hypothetical protein
MISSAPLVQANGLGWLFQWSMNAPIAEIRSLTEVKDPRRMACRVMIEKKHSTRLSHDRGQPGNLADFAGQAGDTAGACNQFAALLPVFEQVLGPQHPRTLTIRVKLDRWTGEAAGSPTRSVIPPPTPPADEDRRAG